jgi:dynein heavy chain
VLEAREQVRIAAERHQPALGAYLNEFNVYVEFLNLDVDEYITEKSAEALESIDQAIGEHREGVLLVQKMIPDSIKIGSMFLINCVELRTLLVAKHRLIYERLLANQLTKCNETQAQMTEQYNLIRNRLRYIPKDVEELDDLNGYIDSIPTLLQPLDDELKLLQLNHALLDKFEVMPSPEEFLDKWNIYASQSSIHTLCAETATRLGETMEEFRGDMHQEQLEFEESMNVLNGEVNSFGQFKDVKRVDQVYDYAKQIEAKLLKAEEDSRTFNSREGLFDEEVTEYDQLAGIRKSFEPYNNLWSATFFWVKNYKVWTTGSFLELDGEQLERDVQSNYNTINKAFKFFDKQGIDGYV